MIDDVLNFSWFFNETQRLLSSSNEGMGKRSLALSGLPFLKTFVFGNFPRHPEDKGKPHGEPISAPVGYDIEQVRRWHALGDTSKIEEEMVERRRVEIFP